MGEVNLPEGWAQTVISDIADVNPKKIEAEPEALSGFVPMSHAPTDFNGTLSFEEKPWGEIKKSYTNFQDHDVIVAKVTPCFENGKAAIVQGLPNGIGAGSSEFYILRPAIKEVSTRFLFSIVKSHKFLQEGAANMTGAVGLRRVPRAFVEIFPVSLPPLAEQKVVANKLDTLLAQVETSKARLDRIPQILKTFRQSVLAAAVSGKLTEEWRGENNVNFEWTESSIAEVCRSISDGDHQAPPRAKFGIPFLVISNVSTGEIDFDSVSRWVPEDYYDSLKAIRKPEINDILYTVTGSFGIPVIVKSSSPFCFQRHIAIIKPNHSHVNFRYLSYFLESPRAFKHAESVATGTAQKTVSLTHLRSFNISIPTLEEQTQIVRRVEELFAFADSIEQKANAALERVNNLTQSILAKAFRGELTADWRAQNPDLISGENSAEALLMKIKAEREALSSKKKPKKKTAARKKA